jgi:hypothetical protein
MNSDIGLDFAAGLTLYKHCSRLAPGLSNICREETEDFKTVVTLLVNSEMRGKAVS